MHDLPPDLVTLISITVLIGGACIGSFLNVCIYRIPNEQSVVHPRSRCPSCLHPIAWYDNIPIVSYVLLRGACRHCGSTISWRYPLVEALTSLLFFLVWRQYGWDPRTLVFMLFVFGLLLATFVDFDHMIIPDRVSLGGMVIGLAISALLPTLHGETRPLPALIHSATGLAVGFGLLWLVSVLGKLMFKKDAMGFGDVKLLGAIGAFTGWEGVVFTIMISSLLGSVVGLTLIIVGGREWQSRIPYGPYLAIAAILWALWGPHWWGLYVDWVQAAG
jgi:leader peptidase (prepilin peptidase) / N-methyltransferase